MDAMRSKLLNKMRDETSLSDNQIILVLALIDVQNEQHLYRQMLSSSNEELNRLAFSVVEKGLRERLSTETELTAAEIDKVISLITPEQSFQLMKCNPLELFTVANRMKGKTSPQGWEWLIAGPIALVATIVYIPFMLIKILLGRR